jgi:hypothetical protein
MSQEQIELKLAGKLDTLDPEVLKEIRVKDGLGERTITVKVFASIYSCCRGTNSALVYEDNVYHFFAKANNLFIEIVYFTANKSGHIIVTSDNWGTNPHKGYFNSNLLYSRFFPEEKKEERCTVCGSPLL